MTCATDIDASFSSQVGGSAIEADLGMVVWACAQGSDSDSVEATPGRVVHEAHMQASIHTYTYITSYNIYIYTSIICFTLLFYIFSFIFTLPTYLPT